MGRGGNGREKRARTDVQPRGVREGLGRFRALLKRAESESIPLPGPSKTHCPALAFHAPPVAAHFALSGSRFLDSGFAYTRNDNGNGDSAFGGIPCASGGVRDEGNGIQLRPRRGLRLFPLDGVARASSVTPIKRKQPVATRPAEFLSLVEHRGFEPLTYRLRTYRSTN